MIYWLHTTLIAAFAGSILVLVLLLMFQRFLRPKTHPDIITLPNGNTNSIEPFFFSWADHPTLVADAVENGWPRFSFATSPSDHGSLANMEVGWEDSMQRITLNLTNVALSVIQAALPLPGPRFGNSSFPQDAYFEMIILSCDEDMMEKSEGENKTILVSVGMTGGHLPLKTPGSFPGSVGFNSNGSVYLNGMKLVFESENDEWGRAGNVIGCGYNPGRKNVFFTVNSKLVNVIHCKTEEFGHPLYPTISANTDVIVLINLGQVPFKFEPANLQRTPNPCFIRPHENSPAIGYEDSKELFSMGRIDSKLSATRSNNNTVNSIKALEFDQESESDLFEIYLR